MKKWFLGVVIAIIIFIVAGLYIDRTSSENLGGGIGEQPSNSNVSSVLKNYGPAPEFSGISTWLNSNPVTIASLKGKVVLIDFWTYSCINCIRTFPYITQWYDTYKDKGLVVIGVHTPEFAFEKETKNVEAAIKNFGIHYPVAQDNEYKTWDAYQNRYWPAEYLIDQSGTIVYTHFGEGQYDVTENTIRTLLGMSEENMTIESDNLDKVGSPEMYLGTERLENLSAAQKASAQTIVYSLPSDLKANTFALQGPWKFTEQNAILDGEAGTIRLKFHSGKVHLVAASEQLATLKISVDGKPQPDITVQQSQLYTLFDSTDYSDHTIDISISGKGFEAFTFTFG